MTTSLLQALLILAALGFMILISFAFIGLGLIFASRMKDMQGFGLVMSGSLRIEGLQGPP